MVPTHTYRSRHLITALILSVSVAVSSVGAQTQFKLEPNKYSLAQDVQVGQEAAAEVRRELPLLDDRRTDDYVERIGRDLVRAIPDQFQHAPFRYSFDVVNQTEINAFALPGGPMFLHRGMLEAAKNEGEVAGVMAHEIAHVALRHGTAQATKGQKFQIGAIAGQILGAIVGGAAGSVIAQGSNFGLGAYFLKYGREYERQADLLGAQIMARAGYDPRRMADMFRTIEQQSKGSGAPEWLSSHPNPGNRQEAILRETASLRVEGGTPSNAEFQEMRGRLASMPPAYTAEQIARAKAGGQRLPGGGTRRGDDGPIRAANGRVAPPAGNYRAVDVGNFLRVRVPTNWREIGTNDSITFAPEGAYYRSESGQTGFTHGVQIGAIPNESHDHQAATDELLDSLLRGNPQLRRQSGGYIRESISGRAALSTTLRNVSEVTGQPEIVTVSTVPLRDGSLLYIIGVVPQGEANQYTGAFRRVKESVQIADQRLTSQRVR
jgi:Zn-dependent protease with chaperone function